MDVAYPAEWEADVVLADGGTIHLRPIRPDDDELLRFMDFAERHGASGVSFWSWQHATAEAWHAVRDAPQFRLSVKAPEEMRKGEGKAGETLLATSGFPVSRIDGTWDASTTDAIAAYQAAAGMENVTGGFGRRTRELLLTPFRVPVGPVAPPKPSPKPPAVKPEEETFVIAGES